MTHKIITSAPYYTSPNNGFRDYIPVNTLVEIVGSGVVNEVVWLQISGQDPNPWKRKWFKSEYAIELTGDNPPEEPPVDPPNEPEVIATIQTFSDGTVKVNGTPFPI